MSFKSILTTIVIAAITAVISVQFVAKSHTKTHPDVLQTVLERGSIRVGDAINPPSLIKDPNTGKLSGIYYDAVEEMGHNMGLQIVWAEEVGWGAMIQGLTSARYDMVVGIWPSATRGKQVNFSVPLYYSVVNAYVRPGDHRFDDVSAINDKVITVAVVDGDTSSIIAKTAFPNAKVISLPQDTPLSHLLLNVKTRKADVTFVEKIIADEYAAKNPNSIQDATPKTPLRLFGNTILIAKNQSGFEGLINTALGELLNSNRGAELVAKYSKYPNALYRPAPTYTPQ